jgi:hypothetical protein
VRTQKVGAKFSLWGRFCEYVSVVIYRQTQLGFIGIYGEYALEPKKLCTPNMIIKSYLLVYIPT